MWRQVLNIILLTIVFGLIWQNFGNKGKVEEVNSLKDQVVLESNKDSFVVGRESTPIDIKISNFKDKDIYLVYTCDDGLIEVVIADTKPCDLLLSKTEILKPNQVKTVDLLPMSYKLFPQEKSYELKIYFKELENGEIKNASLNLNFKEPSFITKAWRKFVYKPIYNALVFISYTLPNKSVGLAIILLTVIIRTILLLPTTKAMKSQRVLQEVQPKLKEIQIKYKDNQAKIAEETIKIWKKYKINPLTSCMPLLLQAPILIGLFYAIKSGFDFNHEYLIYDFLNHVDIRTLNTNFLNLLDLTKRNLIVLPVIVGGLQFIQMKLSMAKTKKAEVKKDKGGELVKKTEMEESMQLMQTSMVYVMPLMVGFFSASFPAGVGIYWASSTIYGIVQQIFINKQVKSIN